jgi:hypothetical protein
LPAPLPILCRLNSGNRQPCCPAAPELTATPFCSCRHQGTPDPDMQRVELLVGHATCALDPDLVCGIPAALLTPLARGQFRSLASSTARLLLPPTVVLL